MHRWYVAYFFEPCCSSFPPARSWALLPLVATRRLGLGFGGYGLLLAALGVGSLIGAVVLSSVRKKLSPNALVAVASLVYSAGLVGAVLSRDALTGLPLFQCGVEAAQA